MKTPLPHQIPVINALLKHDTAAVFLDMGLGKTYITSYVIMSRALRGEVSDVLIVIPKALAKNWKNEILDIAGDLRSHLNVSVFNLTDFSIADVEKVAVAARQSKKKIKLKETFSGKRQVRVFILNFAKIAAMENSFDVDMVVIDESTKIKNPNALRTKKVIKDLRDVKYKLILTGTPVVKDTYDLWAQLYFVGVVDAPFFMFKKAVMDKSWKSLIKGLVIVLKKDDLKNLMKLPKREYITRYVNMTKEQADVYEAIKAVGKRNMLLLGKQSTLQTIMNMQRVTSGFNPLNGLAFEFEAKITELIKVMKEFKLPAVIWARFVLDVETIYERLRDAGYKGAFIHGGVKGSAKDIIIDAFRAGKLDFLVAHPETIGLGQNLEISNVSIYYSNSFNFEHRIQSEDRIHRITQKADKCYYIDLICRNTVDEFIFDNLRKKRDISSLSIHELKGVFA